MTSLSTGEVLGEIPCPVDGQVAVKLNLNFVDISVPQMSIVYLHCVKKLIIDARGLKRFWNAITKIERKSQMSNYKNFFLSKCHLI